MANLGPHLRAAIIYIAGVLPYLRAEGTAVPVSSRAGLADIKAKYAADHARGDGDPLDFAARAFAEEKISEAIDKDEQAVKDSVPAPRTDLVSSGDPGSDNADSTEGSLDVGEQPLIGRQPLDQPERPFSESTGLGGLGDGESKNLSGSDTSGTPVDPDNRPLSGSPLTPPAINPPIIDGSAPRGDDAAPPTTSPPAAAGESKSESKL